MKPDWKNAPEWARFRCMSRYGQWYWCENRPEAHDIVFVFDGRVEMIADRDMVLTLRDNWKESIEERPI